MNLICIIWQDSLATGDIIRIFEQLSLNFIGLTGFGIYILYCTRNNMPETTNQQAVKKRSLSNYLSNVNSRKEELERIAQQEKIAKDAINEEEETEEKGEEKIIPSHESNNDNGTSQKNDTIEPIHQLQEKIIKPKQDTEKEKDSIINQSNEELIPKDMGHKALPIQDTLNDASNANEDIELSLIHI